MNYLKWCVRGGINVRKYCFNCDDIFMQRVSMVLYLTNDGMPCMSNRFKFCLADRCNKCYKLWSRDQNFKAVAHTFRAI